MATFKIPSKEGDLRTFLQNFANATETYAVTLGIPAPQAALIENASIDFSNALTASEAARDAAKGAVASKDNVRRASVALVRRWAQRIKNNPAATPTILAAFGIDPSSVPLGPVVTPTQLSAEARSNGTCRLRWRRAGNSSGTVFQIDENTGAGWEFLGLTTRANFLDSNALAGVQKAYRVRATRAEEASGWSNEAIIYLEGNSELTLAA